MGAVAEIRVVKINLSPFLWSPFLSASEKLTCLIGKQGNGIGTFHLIRVILNRAPNVHFTSIIQYFIIYFFGLKNFKPKLGIFANSFLSQKLFK